MTKKYTGIPILRLDYKTGNGRIFKESVIDTMMAKEEFKNALKAKEYSGKLEHPVDEEFNLPLHKIDFVIDNMYKIQNSKGEKIVAADITILDTENGKRLAEMLDSGKAVYTSIRMSGDVSYDDEGSCYPDDLIFYGFDFVSDPSSKICYKVENHKGIILESLDRKKAKKRMRESSSSDVFLDIYIKTPFEDGKSAVNTDLSNINKFSIESVIFSSDEGEYFDSSDTYTSEEIGYLEWKGMNKDILKKNILKELNTDIKAANKYYSTDDVKLAELSLEDFKIDSIVFKRQCNFSNQLREEHMPDKVEVFGHTEYEPEIHVFIEYSDEFKAKVGEYYSEYNTKLAFSLLEEKFYYHPSDKIKNEYNNLENYAEEEVMNENSIDKNIKSLSESKEMSTSYNKNEETSEESVESDVNKNPLEQVQKYCICDSEGYLVNKNDDELYDIEKESEIDTEGFTFTFKEAREWLKKPEHKADSHYKNIYENYNAILTLEEAKEGFRQWLKESKERK